MIIRQTKISICAGQALPLRAADQNVCHFQTVQPSEPLVCIGRHRDIIETGQNAVNGTSHPATPSDFCDFCASLWLSYSDFRRTPCYLSSVSLTRPLKTARDSFYLKRPAGGLGHHQRRGMEPA